MNADSAFSSFLRALFPEVGPDLLRLYENAAVNSNLLRVDFYTIHDLVELSGYTREEPLHALLLIMLLALDEGSLCIDASPAGLKRRLADLVGETEAQKWAERMAADLQQNGFPGLIGGHVDEGKPVVLHKAGARTYLYFQKYLKHELVLQAELRKRLGMEESSAATDRRLAGPGLNTVASQSLKDVFKHVFVDQSMLIGGKPMQLNGDQRLAIALALYRDFIIVSGGPGTGKTSIVFTLLRCLVRSGGAADRIALAAPTGRAAQRLSDAVRNGLENLPAPLDANGPDGALKNITAKTLHQLLGYNPARDTYRHHAENPLPYDVVIVDEVSMVGLVLMARLFQAIEPCTKLVLLGDKNQLPSVDAGAVLANLAPAERKPCYSTTVCSQLRELGVDMDPLTGTVSEPLQDRLVVLEQNYRSEKRIDEFAGAVNAQRSEVVERLPRFRLTSDTDCFAMLERQGGCVLIEHGQGDVGKWRQVLDQWARHYYLTAPTEGGSYRELVACCENVVAEQLTPAQKLALDRLFGLLGNARVLTLVRDSAWGCTGINTYLEQVLRPRLDRQSIGRIFAGLPVLITRNDSSRLLFNGDVGIALRNRTGYRVFFQRSGSYHAFPAEALPPHEAAFALTVHKSQGSEYNQVLLVLPPEGGRRLLTKEMIYTGITRAKTLAVICSKPEVLRLAVSRKVERESALMGWNDEPFESA